ncbi:Fc.00g063470.m01.CDS01 [Cosmosporella sp. VM-42]
MRTGVIRLGHGVYGSKEVHIVGRMIALGRVPTWVAPWVQNWANAGNVANVHLQYEDALLGPHRDGVAGRPFLVTDNGPPLRFKDLYLVASTLSATRFIVDYPSPLFLLLVAYSIEAYDLLLVRFPLLQNWLPELRYPINLLQPGTLVSAVSSIVDDSAARKLPVEGGIGCGGLCTSLEGLCSQVAAWNEWVEQRSMVKKQK